MALEMSGEYELPQDRATVWRALNDSPRVSERTRQRVRTAAGPAEGDERVGVQGIHERGNIGRHVRHRAPGPRGGSGVSGAGVYDRPQPLARSGVRHRSKQNRGPRRAVVEHQRQAVDGSADDVFQRAPILQLDVHEDNVRPGRPADSPPAIDRLGFPFDE